MKRITIVIFKRIFSTVLHALAGAFVVLLIIAVIYLNSRPDLKVWHNAKLDTEFTADSPVSSFEEYLALEERLFTQLDELVYTRIEPQDRQDINRYHKGSRSDPNRWPRNWNRSFIYETDNPRAGILMLHGMSDAPYSLHTLGETLHTAGAWVIGLRLPGHGTAPTGLTSVYWKDMAAAVELAMRHLQKKVGDKPIYIVGYSNGGALAVNYALSMLHDSSLPETSGLFLLSPAIGVTPVAALAVWQARLGHLLGLNKLEWNTILPEFDPFKYGSFAVNAGDQVYRITTAIQTKFDGLAKDKLKQIPPVLALQSAVDATVAIPDLVHGLFERLPENGHELVLFDINRLTDIKFILANDPGPHINSLLQKPDLNFSISVMTNENPTSRQLVIRHRPAGEDELKTQATQYTWPRAIYSLSHIALPTAEEDPLYGGPAAKNSPGVKLGNLALRGERGVLQVSPGYMLRLHWNPFYSYVEQRLLEFTGLQSVQVEH